MAITPTQEDKERLLKRYGSTFDKLKHYNSQQIGDILVKAHNRGLLDIVGNRFNEKDINECYVAFMIGIGMLKENNITLSEKYLSD